MGSNKLIPFNSIGTIILILVYLLKNFESGKNINLITINYIILFKCNV